MPTLQDQLKSLLQGVGAQPAYSQQQLPTSMENGPEQPPVQGLPPQAPAAPSPQAAASAPPAAKPMFAPKVAAGGMLSNQANIPELKGIQNDLRDQLENSRDAQQGNQDIAKQLLIAQLSKHQGVDLSGAYNQARLMGDPEAGKNYRAPADVTEGDQAAFGAVAKGQGGLTDDITNQLKAELQNKLLGQQFQAERMGMMQNRLNENVYGKQVAALRNDPTLKDLIGKNNSITRTADVLFAPTQDINTTSLHDLQQTVTGALTGLPGGGGVGERSERYMTDMATSLAALKQKFGDTNSIPRNDPILLHYMSLAKDGQAFLQDQANQRIQTLAGGHENITELPTYAPMFHQQIQDVKSGLLQPKTFGAAQAVAAPSHDAALQWVNDPKNAQNPNYGAVVKKLKASGAL